MKKERDLISEPTKQEKSGFNEGGSYCLFRQEPDDLPFAHESIFKFSEWEPRMGNAEILHSFAAFWKIPQIPGGGSDDCRCSAFPLSSMDRGR
jgi:hypothetical protein